MIETPPPSSLREALRRLLERERARGFPGLAGARLSATVPLPGEWINALLRQKPPPGVREIAIALQAENRGVLLVTPELALARRWEVPFRIAPEPAVPARPVLTLHLEPSGLAAAALPILAVKLNREPGITLNGRTLQCNLAELPPIRAAGDLLPLFQRLALHTTPGCLSIELEIAVPEQDAS